MTRTVNSKMNPQALVTPNVKNDPDIHYARQSVELSKGTIKFRDVGNGPVLLLLHGALTNSANWLNVLPELSQHFRCIAPDLPLGGHFTPMPAHSDLSMNGLCDLLTEFLDALSLSTVTVIANDTGGAYAQVFASLYPSRVTAMVLSNCDALDVFPPKPFQGLKKMINVPGYTEIMSKLFAIKPLLTSDLVLGLLSTQLNQEDVYQNYVAGFRKNKKVRADFKKVVNGWSTDILMQAAEELKAFNKPVLILWGSDDIALFPESLGRRLALTFPWHEFELIEGAKTYVHIDQPLAYATRVLKFLEQYITV